MGRTKVLGTTDTNRCKVGDYEGRRRGGPLASLGGRGDGGRCQLFLASLTRFSHHFFETGFEDTDHLDGGPLGMRAGLKKRLWTIAHDHGRVFRPSAS